MTVDMVREIREKTSLETCGMSADELHVYFLEGASRIEKRIAEIRKEKNIEHVLERKTVPI